MSGYELLFSDAVPARAVDVLPDDELLVDEPPDELLLELVCAKAVDMPTAETARIATNAFTGDLLKNWG